MTVDQSLGKQLTNIDWCSLPPPCTLAMHPQPQARHDHRATLRGACSVSIVSINIHILIVIATINEHITHTKINTIINL